MKKNKIVFLLFFILAAAAAYLYFSEQSSTVRSALSDFAVEDTASISKIFLVDNNKKSILLERVNADAWTVNRKYEARQDAVNVLLTTIQRVSVKAPVPKAAFENVVKQIAVKHVKIEIYQGEEEPSKSYYVGHTNPEHTGNYMLLENSSVPFLMHIEGFRGFLTPRYFTNENEWRSTAVFNYGYGEISSVKLEYPGSPEKSFSVKETGNNRFSLVSLENNSEIPLYDTTALMKFIASFQKVHFEGFEETKSAAFVDSVIRTAPVHIFTITDKTGNIKTLKTFLKPVAEGSTDMEGNPTSHDLDRFYGLMDERDFVVLQYFVFDPLLKTADDFRTGVR